MELIEGDDWLRRKIFFAYWNNNCISEICEKWIFCKNNCVYTRFEELRTCLGEVLYTREHKATLSKKKTQASM